MRLLEAMYADPFAIALEWAIILIGGYLLSHALKRKK